MGILITDTTLRDAHQSLIATRMRTRDMLPVVEKMDKVGFFSLEVWGGATFDTCIRYLNEDPWERLRALRSRAKNTRLQMLLRGQNLVGYRHYPDDVVREFIRLAVKNGVDVFRIFDALNDIRNMEFAISVAKEYGAHVQGTICYTTSPLHTPDGFGRMAERLQKRGCDSICIKDMAGLITPAMAGQLMRHMKRRLKVPIALHSHCTSGMAPMSYYAAVLAGAKILDTAISVFSGGASQPATESTVAAFKGTRYDARLDLELLNEINEYFVGVMREYSGLLTAKAVRPDIGVLIHQIPGGMLSNLLSQLKEQKALDRLDEVLKEVPRVRTELGYPPLVTPTSQIVGTQAVLNVISGRRYSVVTQEVKNYLLGHYGRPAGKMDEEVRRAVVGDEVPIEVRPADLLEPELEKMRAEGQRLGILKREEDLITYALYPRIAAQFLRGELVAEILPEGAEPLPVQPVPERRSVPTQASANLGTEIMSGAAIAGQGVASADSGAAARAGEERAGEARQVALLSPMPGMVAAVGVKVGDRIAEGSVVLMIESMKMQNDIRSPCSGVVREIKVRKGDFVRADAVLVVVERSG
ncbi:MAG: pyruvate carboxylase subunit B [Chloroflexi bacterium RBG_13_60_13]|nr:MAG: pyruvate carboxylase subunit B [Chloroflexi bacterium RBG_13_60_13]